MCNCATIFEDLFPFLSCFVSYWPLESRIILKDSLANSNERSNEAPKFTKFIGIKWLYAIICSFIDHRFLCSISST